IVTALIVFVIPVFQKLYGQLHVQLPLPTKCIIALSEAVKSYWPFLVTLIVGSVFGLPKLLKRPDVKSRMDRLKLKLPLVGNLNRMIIVSRYVQTFAMMTSAGIPIVDALAFARKVANNSVFDDASNGIEQQVQAGNPLADSMSKYSIFPSSIINLADAGEKAGILSQMLLKGTEVLDKKIGRAIDSLLTKIEPVMSVLLGLIVGSIMLGVYLPMFDYMGQIK
ncbi:MAG: type II secretion system F family protein, partial [Anaerohalosphaera sp.]|nr:type II secretion system F family protein [Anaerohalosphaera sp.]